MPPLVPVLFILSFVFFAPAAWAAGPQNNTVTNFSLLDHHGRLHTLDYYRDQKAVVIVVQGNGCPIVRKSIPYLNDLKKQFEGQGIVFLMLNSNPQDDHDTITEEAKDFGVEWPILDDRAQVAAAALNVTRTAEAFIIDPRKMAVVYRGPISDKLDYGAERPTMSHEYLKDHLNAFLNGKTLADIVPSVKGCLVSLQKILYESRSKEQGGMEK